AEALPRALVLAKGTQPLGHPSIGKNGPPPPAVTERFSNIYIATISAKGRDVLVALGTSGAAPTLPTAVSTAPTSTPKIQTVSSLKGSIAWRAALVRHANGQEILVAAS